MMYDELVAWLRSWSELPVHCECYESCGECDKQDICATFTNERIITKAGEAADAIEELVATVGTAYNALANNEANKPRWVPVTERLPEYDGDFLVWFYDAKCWKVAVFNKHTAKERHVWWFAGIDRTKFVTHWMPLPEPPKEET